MTLFYRIAKFADKKGQGLTDFFSVLAYGLIFLIFFLLLKFTVGNTTFQIATGSSNLDDHFSTITILKTPVEVDGVEMNIAELIALSDIDHSKENVLKKNILKTLDKSFGTHYCTMLCINSETYKGGGCSRLQIFVCPNTMVEIPGYNQKQIKVSFDSDVGIPPQVI